MYRFIYKSLLKWKNATIQEPLLLIGARQTGKSWILRDFGKKEFKYTVIVDFEKDIKIVNLLNDVDIKYGIDIPKILECIGFDGLEKRPENTLIIFDEVQHNPRMFTALKYFKEERPDIHIAASGSLMGLALKKGTHAPVGSVYVLQMFPMTFYEFLHALGELDTLEIILNCKWGEYNSICENLEKHLYEYILTGGMPEPVSVFIKEKSLEDVRIYQNNILQIYENDFNIHSDNTEFTEKIRYVWRNACVLSGERNEDEIFYKGRQNKKFKEFYSALQWLEDCGLVRLCYRCTQPKGILSLNIDLKRDNAFKVFPLDIGLRLALCHVPLSIFRKDTDNALLGKIIEQFVYQELFVQSHIRGIAKPAYYSWQNRGHQYEIDFMIADDLQSVPVEVKSRKKFSNESLKLFQEQFRPEKIVRITPRNPGISPPIWSLPLAVTESVFDFLNACEFDSYVTDWQS